jgi:hypothetical protein
VQQDDVLLVDLVDDDAPQFHQNRHGYLLTASESGEGFDFSGKNLKFAASLSDDDSECFLIPL